MKISTYFVISTGYSAWQFFIRNGIHIPKLVRAIFWTLALVFVCHSRRYHENCYQSVHKMEANCNTLLKSLCFTLCSIITTNESACGWYKMQVPGLRSRSQVPGPRSQVPGLRSQVWGPRSQVPGSRSQVPGPRPQVSETPNIQRVNSSPLVWLMFINPSGPSCSKVG